MSLRARLGLTLSVLAIAGALSAAAPAVAAQAASPTASALAQAASPTAAARPLSATSAVPLCLYLVASSLEPTVLYLELELKGMEVRAVRTVPADWGVHVWPEGVDWYKFQGNGGHSSGAINFDGHDLALLEIGDLQDSGAEVTGTYLRDDEDEKRPIKLGSGLRLGDCPCVDR